MGDSTPLRRSWLALEQAGRVLVELRAKESDAEAYRDYLPYVLDRLDSVWRTVNEESSGSRTAAFGTWWAGQKSGNREAVRVLRNAELKQNTPTTRSARVYRSRNFIRVHENGQITAHSPDGTELPQLPDGSLDAGQGAFMWVEWEFVVPGLEGRSVQEVLETVLRRLREDVLPVAEKLL